MNTSLIKNQLQHSIPEELFSIEPGQIVYFIPSDGLIDHENLTTLDLLFHLFGYFMGIKLDYRFKVSLVPSRNELLINAIAGRNPQETGVPYKVFVGTGDSIPGIISQITGIDVQEVVDKRPRWPGRQLDTTLPAIVEIDPENRPAKVQSQSVEQRTYQSGFDMEMKIAKPEKGSLAEKKLITKEEKRLEKILRECAVLGIELDIDRIKKKVEDDLRSTKTYQLSIKTKPNPARTGELSVCDIYVADGEDSKLELTSIETAVYLSFLLYKDGVRVLDAFDELRQVTQHIYLRLPGSEKTRKLEGGILDDKNATYDAYMNTLRGYFTTIREAVADKVSDPLIAQEFSIEGFKNAPYGIERSTKEIRKQIKEAFKLGE